MKLVDIVWFRESQFVSKTLLWEFCHVLRPICHGDVEMWTHPRQFLADTRIAETLHESFLTLGRSIAHAGCLARPYHLPGIPVNFGIELLDESRSAEVNEGVADVAIILEINAKVQKVICVPAVFVQELLDLGL